MNLKYLLQNFENMTIKDLATNYDEIKRNVLELSEKIKDVSNKYQGNTIQIEEIPDLMKDISSIIALLQ